MNRFLAKQLEAKINTTNMNDKRKAYELAYAIRRLAFANRDNYWRYREYINLFYRFSPEIQSAANFCLMNSKVNF